jgi:DNA repair exonuclease SbcCD ATPase subunit
VRIAHISDLHIRNLKMHSEYRRVFDDLYAKLDAIKPDLVVNTGDSAHTKSQISPEFVEMTSELFKRLVEYAPLHVILGQHDFNLMNLDRQDAITPIVDSIGNPRIFLHKKSGLVWTGEFDVGKVNLWAFSLADQDNYPTPMQFREHPEAINIGMFHGSISKCVTDSNWRMTHTEYDIGIFDGLDYAMLGDIHKRQSFDDGRIWYAGSLVQQNFGEETDKGFLVWDIAGKRSHTVTPVVLTGSRKFYTLKLADDLSVPDLSIDEDSRIRISPPSDLTLAQQKEIEKLVRRRYRPYDVITLSATNIGTQRTKVGRNNVDVENIRQLAVQERLLRDYLKERGLKDAVIDRALDLNRRYQIHVDQQDDVARNVNWRINKIVWSNLFNYGENNVIDFSCLGGLTGIFAPNASGKSNIIDAMLETCFDATTRGINKNIFLINDNKDVASMVADISANDHDYVIERTIERVKYGQRKFDETKEWGKTTVNFFSIDDDGVREQLVGTLRPETEHNIRQRLGTYEDLMLTSLSAQWNPLDLISCKETERKKILFRFLDLDIFDEKCRLAKDESKQYYKQLSEMEDSGLEEHASTYRGKIEELKERISAEERAVAELRSEIDAIDHEVVEIASKKSSVETSMDRVTLTSDIERAELELSTLRSQVDEKTGQLADAESEIEKVEKLQQKFDLETHEKKVARIAEIDVQLQVLDRTSSSKQQSLSVHRKSIALLNEVPCGDSFPKCKFLVDAFSSKTMLPLMQSDLDAIKSERESLELEKSGLEKFRSTLEEYRKFVLEKDSLIAKKDRTRLQLENVELRINALNAKIAGAKEDLARLEKAEDDIRKNKEIDRRIAELKAQKASKTEALNKTHAEVVELTRLMGSDQGILEKIAEQLGKLQEIRDTCTAYEHYIQAMGKDGIAYTILTQKLPLINNEINKILSNATQFNVFIEHDQEEQSIRLFMQYGEFKSRLIELGSGAEKMLASLAIRAALLSISNLPKPNVFFVDEGFGKLDPEKMESVSRMFDYLKTVFDHVIVISHLDTLKDMVDNVIEIVSDEEGYAHVEIGG